MVTIIYRGFGIPDHLVKYSEPMTVKELKAEVMLIRRGCAYEVFPFDSYEALDYFDFPLTGSYIVKMVN